MRAEQPDAALQFLTLLKYFFDNLLSAQGLTRFSRALYNVFKPDFSVWNEQRSDGVCVVMHSTPVALSEGDRSHDAEQPA
jgi:hypothetical protein